MKVLHLSFHTGCQNDIQYICDKLNIDLTFETFTDGITKGNDIYNVTHERAKIAWDNYKDFYNKFDCIITSDTTPISRVFLQNNWEKKLIIWICNRFDYAHLPDAIKVRFPDKEYYSLINDAKNRSNVTIIGYTPFENFYANIIRKLEIGNNYIKPIGKSIEVYNTNTFVNVDNKKNTFFIGTYHNDNLMMDLKLKIESLGIKVFNGRYNNPKDLSEFLGVIHIPYAWSNLALFEAIQYGIIYFIPSLTFLKYLINTNIDGLKKNIFFWSHPMVESKLDISEWYCKDFQDAFIYFDSWDDLKKKINELDFNKQKIILKNIADKHEKENLEKWKNILLDK